MSRVLLLSTTTGYQLRSFNEAAERLGVGLTFATDRCHTLEDPWQDAAVPVRFHELPASIDAIVAAAARTPFDAVLAVGDRPTLLAAHAAEALELPGNPPDAAAASANKHAMRERFAAAGLPVPWFLVTPVSTDPELLVCDPRIGYPCVVKPLGLSGSRGVIRADSSRQLVAAVTRVGQLLQRPEIRALRTGLEDTLLIEGFIEGREYAVEGVLTGGRLQLFTIFDKPDPLDGPFFEETIYLTPTALSFEMQEAMTASVQRAARALALRHGPVHAECRVNRSGIFVLEIAARPVGGVCSRALRFDGGLSLEDVLLRHAIGQDVADLRREALASGVMMIPIPRRGVLKETHGVEQSRLVQGVEEVLITAKADQLLEPLPEAGSYLGFIFARAASPAEVDSALREAHRRLRFVIGPAIAVG